MIHFDNQNQNTTLPNSSPHDYILQSFSTPLPPTLPTPVFNIFSPFQSLLSLLNFTLFYHSKQTLDVQNASVATTLTAFRNTSMVIPSYTILYNSPNQNSFNVSTSISSQYNSSGWSTREDTENINYFPGKDNENPDFIEGKKHAKPSVDPSYSDKDEKFNLLEKFSGLANNLNDYGMLTEIIDPPGGAGVLNVSIIEPILNGTDVWRFKNINESSWDFDSYNSSSDHTLQYNEEVITIVTAVILAFLILLTVVGNVFVIAAILLERNLQSVANYLILSLAVADLLVAALVMPLGAVYEVSKEWTLGPELCDMWTVSDVLCCTASILHLVAIAIDRYWAVTNLDYIQQRSPKRVGTMIAVIWCVSTLISAAPLMGWKDKEWHGRVHENKICLVSQDLYYQVFATMTSFYLPLGVILILYWRIYQAARKRIRRKVGARTQNALCRGAVAISETTTFTRVSSANESPEKSSNGALGDVTSDQRSEEVLRFKMAALPLNPLALLGARAPRRREMDARRERKAAKTLAVITGAFVICWLPFFVTALLMPLCTNCYFSPYLVATLLWLGYFNSTLNPIIYTIFSPDFRHAFRRILCGKKRLRKRQYDARVSSIKATKS